MKRTVLLTRFALIMLFSVIAVSSPSNGIAYVAGDKQTKLIPVGFFDVPELPLKISSAGLTRTADGYELGFFATSNAAEPIRGVEIVFLVYDSAGRLRAVADWVQRIQLASYATEELSVALPMKVKMGDNDRLLIGIKQVIGRESIWNVVKAVEALKAYAAGGHYEMPEVQRVSNQLDGMAPAVK